MSTEVVQLAEIEDEDEDEKDPFNHPNPLRNLSKEQLQQLRDAAVQMSLGLAAWSK